MLILDQVQLSLVLPHFCFVGKLQVFVLALFFVHHCLQLFQFLRTCIFLRVLAILLKLKLFLKLRAVESQIIVFLLFSEKILG